MATKAKGLRTVKVGSLEMKWTFARTEEFETKSRAYLVEKGVIEGNNLAPAGTVLSFWAEKDMRIYSLALEAATGMDIADISEIIDEDELSRTDLTKGLIESFWMAEDPSRVSFFRESWKNSSEMQEMIAKADTVEQIQKAVDTLKKKLVKLGVPGSPTSRSDSGPTKPPDTA